jgi:hypothetical protein
MWAVEALVVDLQRRALDDERFNSSSGKTEDAA